MKEESHNSSSNRAGSDQSGADRELEARIVALVMGEASDFERDELNRLIQERPELVALKEQFEEMHGLLRDVGAGESPDDDDWRLSADKRNAVLSVIGGDTEEQAANQILKKTADERSAERNSLIWSLTRIAAIVCFVVLPGSFVVLSFWARETAEKLSRTATNARVAELAFESSRPKQQSTPYIAFPRSG